MRKITFLVKQFLYITPYIFVFIAVLSLVADPDLGWHLKYGEYVLAEHKIVESNVLSSSMPSYLWINSGWGGDVILFLIFQHFGFWGLSIAGALLTTATFYLFSRSGNLTPVMNAIAFPLILYLLSPLVQTALKGHLMSLFLFGLLYLLLSRFSFKKNFHRVYFFLPLLFFLWANVHQESLLGVGFFALWVFLKVLMFRAHVLKLLILFVVCVAASLINPFGVGIYTIALNHLGDPLLKNVSEYIPFQLFSYLWWIQIALLLIVVCALLFNYKRKKNEQIFFTGVTLLLLLVFSFEIKRFVWPAYYLLIPFIGLTYTAKEFGLEKYKLYFFIPLVILTFFSINQKMGIFQSGNNWTTYCKNQAVPCSEKAAEFLTQNYSGQLIYTYYDWGGWLIWNYPRIKPSVDGRMHLWRDENGFSAVEQQGKYESGELDITNSHYNIVFIPLLKGPLFYRLDELIRGREWSLEYMDKTSAIIVRKNRI